jgi:small subunit ribosomal protein S17
MPAKILSGIVVSDINDKTIVVNVQRSFQDKLYKKIVKRDKKYHVHDPLNKFIKGQKVRFIEHRPISKKKKWLVMDNE